MHRSLGVIINLESDEVDGSRLDDDAVRKDHRSSWMQLCVSLSEKLWLLLQKNST